MERNDLIHDFSLMLLYLTSKTEKTSKGMVVRASKSYDNVVLGKLADEGLIAFTGKTKSVHLTEYGEEMAAMLVDVYNVAVEELRDSLHEELMSAPAPAENERAFRFRVELDLNGDRECWREIVVPATWTFSDLHEVIQASFLWWGYHLYDFRLHSHGEDCRIIDSAQGSVDAMFSEPPRERERVLEARMLPLAEVFPRTKKATYSYDYGDGWEHRVTLIEAIDCFEGKMPVCTDGAGDAPPEDVGGSWGFEHFLNAIDDSQHPEHEDLVNWGRAQFFERFNLDAVNERIRKWLDGSLFDEWDEQNGGSM